LPCKRLSGKDEFGPTPRARSTPNRRIGTGRRIPVPPRAGNVVEIGPTGGAYAQSRAVRELYLAKLAKIEFEERTAKLVSRDEVTVTAFTKARTVRDSLLNIPDRVAALLAAETDPCTVHQILSDEIRKALIELSHEQRD
jgi:hypothetical protein